MSIPWPYSRLAERVSAHVERYVEKSDELLDEIRRAATYLRTKHGYELWKLQDVCKLHKNSLLRLNDRTWVPKPDTMVALAKLVERAQAVRRGETFSFPERRGPGRPPKGELPACDHPVHKLLKPRQRGNGKTKRTRQTKAAVS